MLKIENLKKTYGKHPALDGLNLTIEKGALFGFVGPNGAGKTTTIKILVGLLAPDEGTVTINGIDAGREYQKIKGLVGYVPDSFGIYDNLKVWEYMEFFASCYGLDGLVARRRCTALLEQAGLLDRADFFVDALSRGMQQRLCLARALIHDPELLVMDEPSSGLDPRSRTEFKELVQELNEQGKTILISSHVLSELAQMCTDIGVIEQGRMVMGGSMKEIMERVDQSNPLLIVVRGSLDRAMAILRSHSCVRTISIKNDCISISFTGDSQDEAQLLAGVGVALPHAGLPGHQHLGRGGHPGEPRQPGHRLHALAHDGRVHGAVGAQDEPGQLPVLPVVQDIGPLGAELRRDGRLHGPLHHDGLLAGADGAVVKGLGVQNAAHRLAHVRRAVDIGRAVARPHADGRGAGGVGRLHHPHRGSGDGQALPRRRPRQPGAGEHPCLPGGHRGHHLPVPRPHPGVRRGGRLVQLQQHRAPGPHQHQAGGLGREGAGGAAGRQSCVPLLHRGRGFAQPAGGADYGEAEIR